MAVLWPWASSLAPGSVLTHPTAAQMGTGAVWRMRKAGVTSCRSQDLRETRQMAVMEHTVRACGMDTAESNQQDLP